MPASLRISPRKLHMYTVIAFTSAILVIILADSFVFNLSVGFSDVENRNKRLDQLKIHIPSNTVLNLVQPTEGDQGSSVPPPPVDNGRRLSRTRNRLKPEAYLTPPSCREDLILELWNFPVQTNAKFSFS